MTGAKKTATIESIGIFAPRISPTDDWEPGSLLFCTKGTIAWGEGISKTKRASVIDYGQHAVVLKNNGAGSLIIYCKNTVFEIYGAQLDFEVVVI